jgi:hypothetical protein
MKRFSCGLAYKTGMVFQMSSNKRPKKRASAKPLPKRIRVEKQAFDKVLQRLIQSEPVKRG